MKSIKINYAKKEELDFGRFDDKYAKGSIKVKELFWLEYIEKRLEFDRMHSKLMDKIPFNLRRKLIDKKLEAQK